MTCSEGTVAENISKIDARLHAMMQGLNYHERAMARMGEMGITTVQCLQTLVDDRAGLRVFIKSALGIDGVNGFQHTLFSLCTDDGSKATNGVNGFTVTIGTKAIQMTYHHLLRCYAMDFWKEVFGDKNNSTDCPS